MSRVWRGVVLVTWAAFFVWLLVSGEVYRYIGPRTQWVVIFGAASLTLAGLAFWFSHGDDGKNDVAGAVVMLLPVVAVLIVPEPTLGSLAASRKLSGGPAVALQPKPLAPGEEVSFREIEYASTSSEYAATTGVTDGLEVELTGFVTATREEATGFSLTRFSIFCCAADVVPHTVEVDAEHLYPKDTWVTVEGVLEERDGSLVVLARSTQRVAEPEDPYIR